MNEIVEQLIGREVASGALGALTAKLLELPQAPCSVRHIFGDGVYMRELTAKAGTLIIGRKQRLAHDCILARGALTFWNPDGSRTRMDAPAEFRAEPGRKVAWVNEDLTFVNVYDTPLQDVDALEALLFEDPAPSLPFEALPPDGDYEALLAEQGITDEKVRIASERDDLVRLPNGAYKFKVGRSRIEGRGIMATADIPRGEIIGPGTEGACRTVLGRFTNHARDCNAMFVYLNGQAWLVAVREIGGSLGGFDGEEITVDYRCTPRARWESLS